MLGSALWATRNEVRGAGLLNPDGVVLGRLARDYLRLPECLGDWVEESNPVRAVDVFVEALDLADLGFDGVQPLATGRPAYHPSTLLKLYIYGYLDRVQSSRRREREAGRNLEVMWLTGRLVPRIPGQARHYRFLGLDLGFLYQDGAAIAEAGRVS